MKQLLLINDVVGYGKVGMGAMLPILSYLGIPTYSLPTALVSNTLDYGRFNIQDTTEYIRDTLPVWKQLGFHFDAICTGLMFSDMQAQLVANYCREQGRQGTTVFVDPIMGDGGRLYNGVTLQQVKLMREMVAVAHLTFPNYTEACYLTDTPFQKEGITWNEAKQLLARLRDLGCRSALITSCHIDGIPSVCGYNHLTGEYFHLEYEEIPGLFHGTGDIFSAVLIGHLLRSLPQGNGNSLTPSTGGQSSLASATRAAMDTVFRMIDRYRDTDDKNRGIPIEQCLDLIGK